MLQTRLTTTMLAVLMAAGIGDTADGDRYAKSLDWLRQLSGAICAEEHYPSSQGSIVAVGSMRKLLQRHFLGEVPFVDGWNRPILYWSDGKSFMLWSRGSDGVSDEAYQTFDTPVQGLREGSTTRDWSADIVIVDGYVRQQMQDGSEEQLETAKRVQTICGALSNRRFSNPEYVLDRYWPNDSAVASVVIAGNAPLQNTDAWGFTIVVWTDGANYVCISPGADGQFDREYEWATELSKALSVRHVTTRISDDIIAVNRKLVRLPMGPQAERDASPPRK